MSALLHERLLGTWGKETILVADEFHMYAYPLTAGLRQSTKDSSLLGSLPITLG